MGAFGKKVEEFISNKKKGICKEGYERTQVGGLWSMCLPKKASTSTTTTTTTTLENTSVPPTPGSYEAQLKAYKDMESKSTPNLPTAQEEAPTKPSNTQNYILYGLLGVAIIALLMRKNN